jgi:hypothetical protein
MRLVARAVNAALREDSIISSSLRYDKSDNRWARENTVCGYDARTALSVQQKQPSLECLDTASF